MVKNKTGDWLLEKKAGSLYLSCPALNALGWVTHGFSTRADLSGADMNMGLHMGDDPLKVVRNRRSFLRGLHLDPASLVAAAQVHGINMAVVDGTKRGAGAAAYDTALPATDALLTADPEVVLSVLTADCVPLLLADPVRRAVAVVHAGWRGAAADIPRRTLEMMCHAFGTDPGDVLAAIGPAIGPCCYEVGTDVADGLPPAVRPLVLQGHGNGRFQLNLPRLISWSLENGGMLPGKIYHSGQCTACRGDLYYSYRREGGSAGRMMAVIGATNAAPMAGLTSEV